VGVVGGKVEVAVGWELVVDIEVVEDMVAAAVGIGLAAAASQYLAVLADSTNLLPLHAEADYTPCCLSLLASFRSVVW